MDQNYDVDALAPAKRARVIVALNEERDYQDQKWGNDVAASPIEWLVAIEDYVAEAKRYWARNPKPQCDEFALHTMRKVGAMAVAAMEKHGVRTRGHEGSRPIGTVQV